MNSFLAVAVVIALFGGLQAKSVFTRSGESSAESYDADKVIDDLCEKLDLLEPLMPPCVETSSCTNNAVLNAQLSLFVGEVAKWYQKNCDAIPPSTPPPTTQAPPPPAKRQGGGQSRPPRPPPTQPSKREMKVERLLQTLLKSIQ